MSFFFPLSPQTFILILRPCFFRVLLARETKLKAVLRHLCSSWPLLVNLTQIKARSTVSTPITTSQALPQVQISLKIFSILSTPTPNPIAGNGLARRDHCRCHRKYYLHMRIESHLCRLAVLPQVQCWARPLSGLNTVRVTDITIGTS